jgi:hypothetical protein
MELYLFGPPNTNDADDILHFFRQMEGGGTH